MIVGIELTPESRPIRYSAWLMDGTKAGRKAPVVTHSGIVRPDGWIGQSQPLSVPLGFMIDGLRNMAQCVTVCAVWDLQAMKDFKNWALPVASQRADILHPSCAPVDLGTPFTGDLADLAALYWKRFDAGAYV